jgi:hypothetical protein
MLAESRDIFKYLLKNRKKEKKKKQKDRDQKDD